MLPLSIINWVLITQSGQSIGKKVIGTQIVKSGTFDEPGFVTGVMLRNWIPSAISFVPCIGNIFGLVDALWIFGEERRCLHDLIAGTHVVRVR